MMYEVWSSRWKKRKKKKKFNSNQASHIATQTYDISMAGDISGMQQHISHHTTTEPQSKSTIYI